MKKFDKLLIGIAFSPNLKSNIFEAVRLANMFDAELVGVHVGTKSDEKKTALNTLLSEADALKKPFKTIWKEGNPVNVILETTISEKIDLLILGAIQKENLFKYYVGSIARKITRKAPCSVLLLIKPSIIRVACKHIVVNGLQEEKTEETIKTAFQISNFLQCNKITIVEEVSQAELHVKVSDDKTLRKANIAKERLSTQGRSTSKTYFRNHKQQKHNRKNSEYFWEKRILHRALCKSKKSRFIDNERPQQTWFF